MDAYGKHVQDPPYYTVPCTRCLPKAAAIHGGHNCLCDYFLHHNQSRNLSYSPSVTMVGVPGRSKACATCKKRRRGVGLQSFLTTLR